MPFRVTICVPEDLIDAANELSKCLGNSEADGETFLSPNRQDDDGNLYSLSSGIVQDIFLHNATHVLEEPEWGADMEKANLAQSKIIIGDINDPLTCEAKPDRIVAIIAEDPQFAMNLLKVKHLPESDEILA